MTVSILAEGLDDLGRYLDLAPRAAKKAARLALNQTVERKGIQAIRALMEEEVAFPPGYLKDPRRLRVSQRAREDNLEAKIVGRTRPTSLARFASGAATVGRPNLSVRVNPDRRRQLSRAFLIRLKAGQGPVSDEAFNLGLAIRLKPGERISNKTRMAPFGGGLYLLYGPSVDQVFRTVAVDVTPQILRDLTDEFLRQFVRETSA